MISVLLARNYPLVEMPGDFWLTVVKHITGDHLKMGDFQ